MHKDYPGRKVFAPFKSRPGFVGGRLDEIDTCVCHRYVKSDIARFLLSSSRAQGLLGGRLDEIDTCVCHRYVKSDIARSTSVDQVNHASLKMCRTFSITKAKQLWIKTILSVAIS